MAAASPNTQATPAASENRRSEGRAGSRRIFPPQFKLQVLEAYRRDTQCRGNQRATARKFGIHRRQIQKWLQAEPALKAALLRRAPQQAPSPPPFNAGSPESARLPSPPPPPLLTTTTTVINTVTPVAAPVNYSTSMVQSVIVPSLEPIDLSIRRQTPPLENSVSARTIHIEPSSRKPFKLFRPYLLEEDGEKESVNLTASSLTASHVSAFVPVQSMSQTLMSGCSLAACPTLRWCAPLPAYPTPLR